MQNIYLEYFKYIGIVIVILIIITAIFYARAYIPHNNLLSKHNPSSEPLLLDTYSSILPKESLALAYDKNISGSDNTITVHYHEKPPYYVTGDFGVYGLCAERAAQIFRYADIPFKWQKTPAPRQLDIIKSNKSRDCGIGWYKNLEREKFAKYSIPFYQDSPIVALKLSSRHEEIVSGQPIKEILSNSGLTLLLKTGYSYGRFVDQAIALFSPKHIVTTLEPVGMVKMIYFKRADYLFVSEDEAEAVIKISGFSEKEFDFIKFSDMPEGNKRYLIFSNIIEDKTIEKLNSAIRLYKYDKFMP